MPGALAVTMPAGVTPTPMGITVLLPRQDPLQSRSWSGGAFRSFGHPLSDISFKFSGRKSWRAMADYPGVPRRTLQYTSGFTKHGLLEWGLEFFACLPALVVLLSMLPDGVGYFVIGLTGATLTRVGDVLSRPERVLEQPEFTNDVTDELADSSQFEVLAFVVGLYIGLSALYSTTILVAAVGGWGIGIVGGFPFAAIVFAGLFPYFDELLLFHTGASVGRLGAVVFGGVFLLILSAYGFSVNPIREIIRQGRPIR